MICYVDSSVILRKLLGQTHALEEWKRMRESFSSRLIRLECLRTLDRWRTRQMVAPEETAMRLQGLQEILTRTGLLPITNRVLKKAEESFPTPVGSLDSIHLATALLWREKHGDDFFFATHDQELGLAAKAYGLNVIGL